MEYMNDFFVQTAAFSWWGSVIVVSLAVLFGVGMGALAGSDGTSREMKGGAAVMATVTGTLAVIAVSLGNIIAPPEYDDTASAASLGESVEAMYGLELTDGVLELLVESVESPAAVVEGEVARFGSVEVAAADGSSAVVQLTWYGSGWVLAAGDGDPLEPLVDGSWQ